MTSYPEPGTATLPASQGFSQSVRKLSLIERKALLKKNIAETDIQFSKSFEIDGGEMFKHACKTGLEGVVSKVLQLRSCRP